MSEVTRQQTHQPSTNDSRRSSPALRPPVDVREDGQSITLYADLPGVTREGLSLEIEGNTLTIDAQADVQVPEGMQSLYAEARAAHYRRSFVLSDELDRDKIDASLNAGVLKLRIPKQAEAQPRRIEIQGAR